MAFVDAYIPLDMLNGFDFSALRGQPFYQGTSNRFIVGNYNGTTETFYGYGFSYTSYGPTGAGTVTGYEYRFNGNLLLSVSGISASASSILNASTTYSTADDLAVIKTALAGNDTIWGSDYNDVLDGFNGNDEIRGFSGNDTIYGEAGNDLLDGGAGADRMTGGSGSDTYVVDNAGDIVNESVSGSNGTDIVLSSISFNLADTTHVLGAVESLALLGAANINATGNALNNVLLGNAGNNVLNGGAGADRMAGEAGNDTYVVDNAGDVIDESLPDSDGIDTVRSSISFNLADAAHVLGAVENLTLLGTANINASGNALNNALTGNAGVNVLNGGAGADVMVGGAGNDTYVVDNADDIVNESPTGSNGIDTVRSAISFSLADTAHVLGAVENLTLLGTANIDATGNTLDNVLMGNAGDNFLDGGFGADKLDGGAGVDVMAGGAGNDTYVVDNAGDIVDESPTDSDGIDTVLSGISFNLADAAHVFGAVENLTLLGTANINAAGNSLDNVLIGNAGANFLDGGAGADKLDGGAGADIMAGEAGNDTYVVDNAGDIVDEGMIGSDGTDTVRSTVSFSLADTLHVLGAVENLTLLGTANVNATGNELDNVLTGNAGVNVLNGGAGADVMAGGAGNDTYVVDNAGDIVNESPTGSNGIDTVRSAISFSLADTAHVLGAVENLTLLGTANINATGNALNNVLIGNAGVNILDGAAGADKMTGGSGSDTYVVENAGDIVDESPTGSNGTDTVLSAISFSLADTLHVLGAVENLTLLGTANINASGNALNNVLIGNAGNNALNGGAGADKLDGGAGADKMAGGAGNDTYVVDNASDIVNESVFGSNGIDTVRSAISFNLADAVHVLGAVENLTLLGTANINASGNALNNALTGNAGVNVLNGGAGADVMAGGAGNDTYVVDNAGDIVNESPTGSNGIDTVRSAISFNLADAAHVLGAVENLTLLGTANINASGNALNNALIGNAGVNVLNGGAGADVMAGGAGNDTYVVDNADDIVNESPTGSNGIDTVRSAISFNLADTAHVLGAVENLTLLGTANIDATGNALNNMLIGNAGSNILDGGAGADRMRGGAGNDTYVVDNAGDIVDESVAGSNGIDTVLSGISFSLADTTHVLGAVENLTLLGTANVNATGNELDNVLTGNDGNNVLNGGAGADTMAGGAGNDTYVVDNAGDVIDEGVIGSDGTDTVRSGISFSLADTIHVLGAVENLTLLGTANINATGNELDNVLIGNAGNNILDGGAGADVMSGGSGADTMAGGAGNDTYVVDNAGDVINEGVIGSDGTDTVRSAISFSLADTIHVLGAVENLTLLGTANINATGNELDNVLTGNAGNNVLNGGAGNDLLTGGSGADTFVFDRPLDATRNVDTITDFDAAADTIRLSKAVFAALGPAPILTETAFHIGEAAHDANDRIIYNPITGALSYDADGNGTGAAVQFATLGTGLALTHADFVVV